MPPTDAAPPGRMRTSVGPWVMLLLVVLLAVRLGMIWVAYPRLIQAIPEWAWANNDGYDRLARHWVADGVYALHRGTPTALRAPLYPMLNAGAMLAAGEAYPSLVMFVQALLSVWTGWLLVRLAADTLGRLPAALTLGLFILHPQVNNFIFRCATETLFLFLVTGWLFHLSRYAGTANRRNLMCSVVYAGMAYLTRSTLGLLPLVLYPVAAWCARRNGRVPPRRLLADGLLAIGMIGLVVSPWALRNMAHTGGRPVLQTWVGRPLYQGIYVSENLHAFLRGQHTLTELDEAAFREVAHRTRGAELASREAGHSPVRVELDADRHGRRLALEKLRGDPAGAARRWGRNLILAPVLQMTWRGTLVLALWNTPLLLLSLAGLAMSVRQRKALMLPLLSVVLAFGYFLALHAFAWPQARYVMPALIPFSIFAGVPAAWWIARCSNRRICGSTGGGGKHRTLNSQH